LTSSGQKNRKQSGKLLVGHPMLGEDGMSDSHMMLYQAVIDLYIQVKQRIKH
jgi:hypothetical protein